MASFVYPTCPVCGRTFTLVVPGVVVPGHADPTTAGWCDGSLRPPVADRVVLRSWKVETVDGEVVLTLNGTPYRLGASAYAMAVDLVTHTSGRVVCRNELSSGPTGGSHDRPDDA